MTELPKCVQSLSTDSLLKLEPFWYLTMFLISDKHESVFQKEWVPSWEWAEGLDCFELAKTEFVTQVRLNSFKRVGRRFLQSHVHTKTKKPTGRSPVSQTDIDRVRNFVQEHHGTSLRVMASERWEMVRLGLRVWAPIDQNIEIESRNQGAEKVMCWAAMVHGKVYTYWFKDNKNVTGETYLEMLSNVIWSEIKTVATRRNYYFQQDGAVQSL